MPISQQNSTWEVKTMRLFRITVALLLVLALAATASAAGKGKKNKKATKPIRGVIVAVDQDQGKDTGTITVRVQKGKKAAADAAPEEKKITVSDTTKLTKVSGKKKQQQTTDAAFKDLAKDQRVVVKATNGSADTVTIVQHGKKAKKNEAA
jgi:hypothetical protein